MGLMFNSHMSSLQENAQTAEPGKIMSALATT